jgi:myo-inositol catabolism protein IolS
MAQNAENQPTKMGLGCWPLGGDQWGGRQDDGVSLATIAKAYEIGIRHFDTAQMYGKGHGEELIGKALNPVRANVFIATKLLYLPKDKVEAAVAVSLKRLQTDWIDLLYIHWPKKNGDLAGMMEALEKLREKRVIRQIGVSNFSVSLMQQVMQVGKIDAHQLCYNLLWRREERETIPFCRKHDIPIVTYSSLAEGILTGKFKPKLDFVPGDHRKYTLLFEEKVWPKVFEAVEKLKGVAVEVGCPLSYCAIRWLLSQQGVGTVLVGSRTPEQVADNYKALEGIVQESALAKMTEISNDLSVQLPDEGNIFKWYP